MLNSLSLLVGVRYTRARSRNQFISFISLISLLGMILGVFALVVVMSVMNGFEAELRDRILSVVPHGFIEGPREGLSDWQALSSELDSSESVKAVAPYINSIVMLSRGGQNHPAQLTAVSPSQERAVSELANRMVAGDFDDLKPGEYGVVIGEMLARRVGVYYGDRFSILVPKVTVTPFGIFPRSKTFKVVGVFRSASQLDSDALFIHLQDGQKLFQLGERVEGLRVQLNDLFDAPVVVPQLVNNFPEGSQAKPWSETQGSLFKAVKMEKTMVSLLLLAIVAIAAFNIISILTMMVSDKRSAIAVLRTMGASPATIMRIFIIQGMTIGLVGILVGIALGIPVVLNLTEIIMAVEKFFGGQLFNPQVYYISQVPTLLKMDDLLLIVGAGIVLSILATLYPAYRASKIEPAEVLRYE